MTQNLLEIVMKYRRKGAVISDHIAEKIYCYCQRKITLVQIQNPEEYLPILYADELKNYLFREAINAKTMFITVKKEVQNNV